MSYGWIFYIIVSIIICFSFLSSISIFSKIKKENISNKNQYILNATKGFIYLMLVNTLYLGHNLNNLRVIFIFGLLIITWVLSSFTRNFIDKLGNIRLSLFVDFIMVITVSIYLIYKIPNIEIKNIILSFLGPVFGGAVTLVGVLLTLKYNEKKELERHNKSLRPIIYPISKQENEIIIFNYTNDIKKVVPLKVGNFIVVGNNDSFLEKIFINNKEFKTLNKKNLSPNNIYKLDVAVEKGISLPLDIKFIIRDVENNILLYKVVMSNLSSIESIDYVGEYNE